MRKSFTRGEGAAAKVPDQIIYLALTFPSHSSTDTQSLDKVLLISQVSK